MIEQLSIHGFRGFGVKQPLDFSIPDGNADGSGLTVIVGANNTGKTTIIESIKAFNGNGTETPAFSEGRRNMSAEGRICLELIDENAKLFTIKTIEAGGSSTERNEYFPYKFYVLQSRRYVPYEFGRSAHERSLYINISMKLEAQRQPTLNNFETRIFKIIESKDKFDNVIHKVLGQDFIWTIEQRDNGQFYIKYSSNGVSHSSEGSGDGIWSIFTICDALYDSAVNDVIVIDEPELSLHPMLQKRLMRLLLEYSKDRQIILATHSAHFISWEALMNHGSLIRVAKEGANSMCYSFSDKSRANFGGLLKDLNNPHTLGTDATEAFFLEDNVILVEGQDDVVIFQKIAKELNIDIEGEFWGWGVGGASKMPIFLGLLKDLGYQHVVVIFDGDKFTEAEEAKAAYPEYHVIILKTDDIRDKEERPSQSKTGIVKRNGKLKDDQKEYAEKLLNEINKAFI